MAAPANDDFADAEVITGPNGTVTGTNVDATFEVGEPPADDGGEGDDADVSVWYRWVADGNGPATFDTVGSNFDTVLNIYTGSAIGSLTLIAGNDDSGDPSPDDRQSRVTFTAAAGVTYQIRVNGYSTTGGSTDYGDIILNWNRVADPADPDTLSLPSFDGDAMNFTFGTSRGISTDYLTYEFMSAPPLAGDIVFGFVYQAALDNPDLAVSDGWTVDHQNDGSDGSWIVFHRAIVADDEVGPTVSGIVTGFYTDSFYAGFVWTYRDFHGFDAATDIVFSASTSDLDSPSLTATVDNSVETVIWVVPTPGYPSDDESLHIPPADEALDWGRRFPGVGGGGPLSIYDNQGRAILVGNTVGTYGPVTAHRYNIFDPDVDLTTPYFSVMWSLRPGVLGGGWGVGMVRMGAN